MEVQEFKRLILKLINVGIDETFTFVLKIIHSIKINLAAAKETFG